VVKLSIDYYEAMGIQNQKGFTLVEIVIVIAVIGILATVSMFGFSRVQADSRDSERASSTAVIVEGLERYYEKNGEYPSCSKMTASASVVGQTLGIDPKNLQAPSSSNANSMICTDITTSTTQDVYAYVGDGTAVCSTGAVCTLYTVKYKEESTGQIKSVPSRRVAVTAIITGTSTLSNVSTAASSVNLSWTAAANAVSYVVETSKSNTFPEGSSTTQTSFTSTTGSVTGLLPVTPYYFRIQATGANGTKGGWSNIVSATTASIAAPAISNSSSPIGAGATLYITPSDGANAYIVQRARDAAFTNSLVTLPTSTSTTVVDDPTWGFNYYYRAKAINTINGQESGYGPSRIVTVPRP